MGRRSEPAYRQAGRRTAEQGILKVEVNAGAEHLTAMIGRHRGRAESSEFAPPNEFGGGTDWAKPAGLKE